MWWRPARADEKPLSADLKEYLIGFGEMFQRIDAKLEQIVELLSEDDDDD